MKPAALKSLVRAKLGFVALVTAGVVAGQQLSPGVEMRVNLVTSSGVCEVVTTDTAPQAHCAQFGGPLLPETGAVPYQRAGTSRVAGIGAATQPPAAHGDGTKVTSWRVVELDNGRYIELTIAW